MKTGNIFLVLCPVILLLVGGSLSVNRKTTKMNVDKIS